MIHQKWGLFIALVFIASIVTCLSLGVTLLYGFIVTLAVTSALLKAKGVRIKETLSYALEGIGHAKTIYFVVFMIGINVALWIASGIVPSMIYYGFSIVNHVNFILFAFLVTAVFALFIGTGLGTLSTIGVAIFSLGLSAGMPKAFLLGVILSGAYVADRLSPISALVNFTIETVGVSFKVYFVKTLKQMLPAMVLTGVIYLVMSLNIESTLTDAAISGYKSVLSESFIISGWFFIVPVGVLALSLIGFKSNLTLGFGVISSILIAALVQHVSLPTLMGFMYNGFHTDIQVDLIKSLQIGGGKSMIEVVFIIMGGIAMSTIFEKCGWIKPLINFVTQNSKTKTALYLRTSLMSIGLDALTCDQTVGIIIPGRNLKEAFIEHNLDAGDLAALIANSGTALAPLMPWNVNAIIILAITGVPAVEFAPFMIFNFMTIVWILMHTFLKENVERIKVKPQQN
ncbi:Na+/H+ antiporter NhaC family protein [Fusibacter sp. 3D3]|uniref:Na+/H+ antiporter NhaC family protein n=1 Tax=Fusibacter sp. 3D3 TaxID=1048380 RepID=UPI000853AD01|nr:Na+/H+ antiporter NhaC family protein [Fusibacter sp. 3D3]GAU77925.1 Na+/H+ antiporter NhaC [Fusibacter sp. 3D3]